MAQKRTAKSSARAAAVAPSTEKDSRSREIAEGGITTATDFAKYMSALMADISDGSVAPQQANAICNAGGKLLKVVEMQYKYGNPKTRMLTLS